MSKGKILVIRGGAIGDFILTLPVLAALRRQFPETAIEVLGYAHIAQLALAGGLADAVRSIEARALAGFFARGGKLDPELQDYFAGFAVIVSYLYDPDEIFRDNIARSSKAQFIAAPHRPRDEAGVHATEVFLGPLERLAIFQPDPVPRLRFEAGGCEPAEKEKAILALHPGSGSEKKNWPEKNWAELLQQLMRRSGMKLLLVGGEAEEGRLDRLAKGLPRDRGEVLRNLPLVELARRLSSCAGFIGHDSGISHLSAALGLPCVLLWGESREAIWRPRGDTVRLVRDAAGLAGISVERVLEELSLAYLVTQ